MFKKFTLKKTTKSDKYFIKYVIEKNNLLKNINFQELNKIINLLKTCIKKRNIIYSCGNGGSSSLSDHFTCDFLKQANLKTNLNIKAISLSSNFSLISAIANDISYDEIFSFQVEKLCKKNDLLFLFSVSGNSKNLIKAAHKAKRKGLKTVSFTGFNGGKLSKITNLNINFPISNYGIVEDCHITMMHFLSQFLRISNIKKKNLKNIFF